MSTVSRRGLLTATAALLPLGACSLLQSMTPAQIVADAQSAATGLLAMLKQVSVQYPALIPPATLATLETDLTLAQQAADNLSTNLPAPSATSTVKIVEGYLNAVLNTLAAPPINGLIPAPFNMIVAAAAFVVPQLEAFAAQYIPAAAASPATAAARAKLMGGAMPITSEAQAVAILRAAAGK